MCTHSHSGTVSHSTEDPPVGCNEHGFACHMQDFHVGSHLAVVKTPLILSVQSV